MRLLSYEKTILCHYITATEAQRKAIFADAKADPKTSGPLILALEWASRL